MRRRPRANDEPGPAFRGPRRDFNDRQSDDGRPGHRRGFRGRGPGAGRGPGPDDAPAFSRDLTGEQVEHMLSFLKDKFPSRFEQLQKLRETNPDVFDPRFRRMAPRIQRMMQAFERHPETAEMMVREHQINVQIDVLVDRFFDARDENVLNEIHGQIRDLVAERFELRQQRRQREIETMQRRLESIREQLQHDTQQRDDIIEHELKDLGVTDR